MPVITVTGTPAARVTEELIPPATPVSTPLVTPAPKEPSSNAITVIPRLREPIVWRNGKLELVSLQVQVYNLRDTPLSIKAQILNDGQILEEKSFVLKRLSSNYEFTNEKKYFLNSTNVTLRVMIQGYEPSEYKFTGG